MFSPLTQFSLPLSVPRGRPGEDHQVLRGPWLHHQPPLTSPPLPPSLPPSHPLPQCRVVDLEKTTKFYVALGFINLRERITAEYSAAVMGFG